MSDVISTISLSAVLKQLIPSDDTARKITLIMLVPVALAYIGRILIQLWLDSERGPFGSMWWIICPAACAIAAGLGVLILLLATISVRSARHLAPALVLLVGIVSVPFLPLPPLPRPVFPEEEFFYAHRAEFEQAVELARQDELQCIREGCEYLGRLLPRELRHLSTEGYVSVYHELQSGGLTVEFRPFTFYYPVVYFEMPGDRNLQSHYQCHGTGSGHVRKLDEHWWVCVEDWL